jgi:protoporphyrinogen oxidase
MVGVGAMMRRRDLLQGVAACWFADQVLPDREHIRGHLIGASHCVGHKLREPMPDFPDAPAEKADVVIVGSGISGLTAAWRLQRAGVSTTMLELEPFAGGTSTWSDDGAVQHPWGAHYLPVPEKGARAVARLLEELDVIRGWDAAGRPQFDEMMLCHAPEERLFFRGNWHGGTVPYEALTLSERHEIERFQAAMHDFKHALGNDGREAFSIPASASSRDPKYRALDDISMATWLERERFTGEFVRWFAEYGTLDDFGAELDDVSAWAGIHYFASRKLDGEQLAGSRYLVWPEGNGWLARHLVTMLPTPVRTGALVVALMPTRNGVDVVYYDVAKHTLHRIAARAVIAATPAFVTRRLIQSTALPTRTSSPWLVANLHVDLPIEPNHAWDNIIYDSPGLGYVDASHQRTQLDSRTVLTYFRAYGQRDTAGARAMLLNKPWAAHASDVLTDLSQAHPNIVDQTERIDIMLWGHAMPRPRPGFLRQPAPTALSERIAWAHVDQTGFALFEEATHHGVTAAEQTCTTLDVPPGESYL